MSALEMNDVIVYVLSSFKLRKYETFSNNLILTHAQRGKVQSDDVSD